VADEDASDEKTEATGGNEEPTVTPEEADAHVRDHGAENDVATGEGNEEVPRAPSEEVPSFGVEANSAGGAALKMGVPDDTEAAVPGDTNTAERAAEAAPKEGEAGDAEEAAVNDESKDKCATC
jgi:hypothetical protein